MRSLKNSKALLKVYQNTFLSFKKNHLIYLPFLIFAVAEAISLILIVLAPRTPLVLIFGPPIRTFWGEGFLHYPANFLLLPKLASLSRMFLSLLLGSLLTGIAVLMLRDYYNNKRQTLTSYFKVTLSNYPSLFLVVLIFTASFYFLTKVLILGLAKYFTGGHRQLLFLSARTWMGPILLFLNFLFIIFIQSIFVFAIPLIMIEKRKFISAIAGSFSLFRRMFLRTIILIILPMLLYLPIIILNYKAAFLIEELFPEAIFIVLFAGIIISSLIVDPVITISATCLYLLYKEDKKNNIAAKKS